MHDIVALKDMLCEELEEYGRKGEMSAGTLEIVDKLAHAVKNLGKIIKMYEDEEYSSAYGGNMDSGSYRGGNRPYARGRSYARGRNARRDSMGRYSGDAEELVEQLEDMMDSAPDEQTRMELKRLVKKMKSM